MDRLPNWLFAQKNGGLQIESSIRRPELLIQLWEIVSFLNISAIYITFCLGLVDNYMELFKNKFDKCRYLYFNEVWLFT